MLDQHAQFLALVAVQSSRYEDMADAAEGAAEAARGLSTQPDEGRHICWRLGTWRAVSR